MVGRLLSWLGALTFVVIGSAILVSLAEPQFGSALRDLVHRYAFCEAHIAPARLSTESLQNTPLLGLELGHHNASPKSLAVDKLGQFMVTGSLDGTIRVWSLPAPEAPKAGGITLIDVLRPPMIAGAAPQVYSVAISGNGQFIAAGAWRGQHDNVLLEQAIYIFDRASGKLLKTLSVPTVANSLAFSRDEHRPLYLAAGLAATGGLRVWRVGDWQSVTTTDSSYRDSIFGVAFNTEGRLATTSFDGHIRLYDEHFSQYDSVSTPAYAMPFGIAFSPWEKKIAFGDAFSPAVGIVDYSVKPAKLLAPLGAYQPSRPDEPDERNGSLSVVSWSNDGHYLFAGGTFSRRGKRIVHRWNVSPGHDDQTDFDSLGNNDTIQGLAPYGQTDVLLLASDPLIGAYDGDSGESRFPNGSIKYDYGFSVSSGQDFKEFHAADTSYLTLWDAYFEVSPDGRIVDARRFHFDGGKREIRAQDHGLRRRGAFQQSERIATSLVATGQAPGRLDVSQTSAPIENYYRTSDQSECGTRIEGFDDHLSFYSKENPNPIWRVDTPDVTLQVALTADEKMVIAAFGDGTLRWYRTDGDDSNREILALFVSKSDNSWIAWTPSGYYDASAGGHKLVGWTVPVPGAASTFYSAEIFRDVFYRPGLISAVLNGQRYKAPAADAIRSRELPIVHINDVAQAKGQLTVRYSIYAASGLAPKPIRCLIGGVLCTASDESKDDGSHELNIALPRAAEAQVSLSASTDGVHYGDAVRRTIPIDMSETAIREAGHPAQGTLYALLIGVNDPGQDEKLNFAERDASELAAMLQTQEKRAFQHVKPQVLVDGKANRDSIAKALLALEDAGPNDVSLLFIAGHGLSRQRNETGTEDGGYFFLASGANKHNAYAKGVSFSDILQFLLVAKGRKLIFLDTCGAGRGEADIAGMAALLGQDTYGADVFASATGNQDSTEQVDWGGGHGAFAFALLDVLYGRSGADKSRWNDKMVDCWLRARVSRLTGGSQTPVALLHYGEPTEIADTGDQPSTACETAP